ncbi:hypothetical protein KGY77_05930 [Candidatus Bipolaricaulota bacterium]|nr:hypothetical protein [Candidatus Bipolaricaulota bacterium]MBS3792166.1 hypothetical protein [Candidatus Bipolaricaulota bacterium]
MISQKRQALRRLGIRPYRKILRDQPGAWLVAEFGPGTKYPVVVSTLVRNLIWQAKERIESGKRPPIEKLIRSFWYSDVKPTLQRAGSLSSEFDQYEVVIDQLARLVRGEDLMRYRDLGFGDASKEYRKIGSQPEVIVIAEKEGDWSLLREIHETTGVTVLAFGGQPSNLTAEYFVDDLREKDVNLQKNFYLFSITDYDPAGWIVRDSFISDLNFYGVSRIEHTPLVTPDQLTEEEIEQNKYRLPGGADSSINKKWAKKGGGIDREFYGFEADAIPAPRMKTVIRKNIEPYISTTPLVRKRRGMGTVADAVDSWALARLRGGLNE